MKPSLLIASIAAALLAGGGMALNWTGVLVRWLPTPLRPYALFSVALFYVLGGLLIGLSAGRRWKAPATFAVAACVPGYWIPLLTMATQGLHRPLDLFLAQWALPMLAHGVVGMVGGLATGQSWRPSLVVGAAFALGVALGPALAWTWADLLGPVPSIIVAFGTPWLTGGATLARLAARTARAAAA